MIVPGRQTEADSLSMWTRWFSGLHVQVGQPSTRRFKQVVSDGRTRQFTDERAAISLMPDQRTPRALRSVAQAQPDGRFGVVCMGMCSHAALNNFYSWTQPMPRECASRAMGKPSRRAKEPARLWSSSRQRSRVAQPRRWPAGEGRILRCRVGTSGKVGPAAPLRRVERGASISRRWSLHH